MQHLTATKLPLTVLIVTMVAGAFALTACTRSISSDDPWKANKDMDSAAAQSQPQTGEPTLPAFVPPTRVPGAPILTPTPDSPHIVATPNKEPESYTVEANDTLGEIAQKFTLDLEQLIAANTETLPDPNRLEIGQVLVIPAPDALPIGPDYKIIPDSELVYGPMAALFNVEEFVRSKGGYLSTYQEVVDDRSLTGIQIIERVSQDYSVNPRLLLAVLEYQSKWVTQPTPTDDQKLYPIGLADAQRQGLYRQLTWAANSLSRGYYVWRVGAVSSWLLADGTAVPIAPSINAGTAGVQQFFAYLLGNEAWRTAVGAGGLFSQYDRFFGYPFDLAIEPLVPAGLAQPAMQLPFEPGVVWSFTGGPHGGWADGSAWAALDFAPPNDDFGCFASDEWVVAVADGVILRASNGAVMQDLDSDGLEQTGWNVLYMHVEARDRVQPGTFVRAGEKIGHASCEGGLSNGTHVHVARKYNGEWISADGSIPFVLDGWVSSGNGTAYDGFLTKNGQVVEAWDARNDENQIQR